MSFLTPSWPSHLATNLRSAMSVPAMWHPVRWFWVSAFGFGFKRRYLGILESSA